MSAQLNAFHDSLSIRAKQLRFRGIGNPFAFLESIGIIPIKEYIFKGATIIDVAEELNIPITYLIEWINQNDLKGEIDEASVLSAEGYIAKGERMLREANNTFDLNKAKAIIEHGRFMASKKDKRTYGNTPENITGADRVTYNFIIGNQQAVQIQAAAEKETPTDIIEGEAQEVKQVEFTPLDSDPFKSFNVLGTLPQHIKAVLPPEMQDDEDNAEHS